MKLKFKSKKRLLLEKWEALTCDHCYEGFSLADVFFGVLVEHKTPSQKSQSSGGNVGKGLIDCLLEFAQHCESEREQEAESIGIVNEIFL